MIMRLFIIGVYAESVDVPFEGIHNDTFTLSARSYSCRISKVSTDKQVRRHLQTTPQDPPVQTVLI